MALGAVTFLRNDQPGTKAGDFGVKTRLVQIIGDSAIGAGGTPVTAANFRLNAIDSMLIALPFPIVNRKYIFDKANSKIQAQVAAGTEFTGDASADRIIALIFGR